MTLEDRRARGRAARHQLIINTARRLAEAEGWDAVTTRRLSTEIEYSQPVSRQAVARIAGAIKSRAENGMRVVDHCSGGNYGG